MPAPFGLNRLSERLANPDRVDFAVGGLVGVPLSSFPVRGGVSSKTDDPGWEMTPQRGRAE